MLHDKDSINQSDGRVNAQADGHFIAWDGIAEPILASTVVSDDGPKKTDVENNNLSQAISLYLSQCIHRH